MTRSRIGSICRLAGAAAAIVALALLHACGGGASAGGVGEGGTGFAGGTVNGFGSLIVGGFEFATTQARYAVDEDPRAPRAAVAGDIALGMQVALSQSGGSVQQATVGAEVIGPVDAVDAAAGSLQVLGQAVRIDAAPAGATVLDGVATLASLAPGSIVEVHGQRASDGTIDATRVALRSRATGFVRLAGPVGTVDPSRQQLTIGGETVSYGNAQRLAQGGPLVAGVRVVAYSTTPPGGGVVAATALRIDGARPADVADARVDGFVNAFASIANLHVGIYAVDASAAVVSGGGAQDIVDGAVVRVHGAFAGGTLLADAVQVLRTAADAPVRLTGPITNFVAPGYGFRVRGAPVQWGAAPTIAPATTANLANGVAVAVDGVISSGAVSATSVQVVGSSSSDFVPVVAGDISQFDAATGTFRLGEESVLVQVGAATSYLDGAATNLADGRRVVASGSLAAAGGPLAASTIQFLDNPANPPGLRLEGTASGVTSTSFTLDGQTIGLDAQTQYFIGETAAGANALVEGSPVVVQAQTSGGSIVATVVSILGTDGVSDGGTRVDGYITSFDSLSSFVVANQPVDASAAQLVESGTAVAPANGVYVSVTGTLSNGVLVATRVVLGQAVDD